MSRFVAALVYQKRIGSMARKSILAYCAERANDDGSGVWASKVRIAKEVECSKQTVIDTMRAFVAEGLLIEAGKRRTSNGYVIDYRVNVAAVKALPDAIEDVFSTDDQSSELTGPDLDGSSQLTPRGQATGPQEVKPVDPNRPLTVLKPSNGSREEPSLFPSIDQPESQSESPKSAKKKEDRFPDFWKVYPRKVAKDDARKAFAKAVKQADPDDIIAGAERYALEVKAKGTERAFIKHPQGWLNAGRWKDEIEAPPPSQAPVARWYEDQIER